MKYLVILSFILFFPATAFLQINHWETALYANDIWSYQAGTVEPPQDWQTVAFDDAGWLAGEGSIGYGDGDDNTIISQTASLYMRQRFTVTDKTKIARAVLHADYDDGFVAYLNGVEIARANLEGTPPAYDAWTPALREAMMYQGGLPMAFYLNLDLLEQTLVDGENVLAIQTHNFEGVVSSDMTTLYWLSFGINDTSNDYGPIPSWFDVAGFESPLPIVTINTGGTYIPDEPSVQGEMGIIWNGDGVLNSSLDVANEFLGNITIERRGQSSLGIFPKTGYGIETKNANWEDEDVAFLNFPEEEDWILHGPYSDKSLIRNVLSMQIARSMGQYASRTRLVELVINEGYEGVYVLMERIKRDKNRVDIAKLKPEDIAGDSLTGGYVFKIDKGTADWYSKYDMEQNPGQKVAFQFVSPKRSIIQPEQSVYLQSYVDSFEMAMRFPDAPFGGKYYYEYMDLESFADQYILQELTRNVDAYLFSSYFYKDKDSKGGLLKAGPAWDFNLAFGNADFCDSESTEGWTYDASPGCYNPNPFWWNKMFKEEAFTNTVKCRWKDFRSGVLSLNTLFTFIDEKTTLLDPVVDRNFQRWPILNEYVWPNSVVTGSYQGEIDFLKDFIAKRIAWMDDHIFGNCLVNTQEESAWSNLFKISPNPVVSHLQIELNEVHSTNLEIIVLDVLGRIVLTKKINENGFENQIIELDVSALESKMGLYVLKINVDGELHGNSQMFILAD